MNGRRGVETFVKCVVRWKHGLQ